MVHPAHKWWLQKEENSVFSRDGTPEKLTNSKQSALKREQH